MKKCGKRYLSLMLTIVLLCNMLLGSVSVASAQGVTGQKNGTSSKQNRQTEGLSMRVDAWEEPFEAVWDQSEADALRVADATTNVLIAADACAVSGQTFGEMVSVGSGTLKLTDSTGTLLSIEGNAEVSLCGVTLEQLVLVAEKDETAALRLDEDTKIPEIVLQGEGRFRVEGNGALGLVRVENSAAKLNIGATCSVLNESDGSVPLEMADGTTGQLQAGEQKEIELNAYLVTFMADGQVYQTALAEPGEIIPYPEQNPEKEGFVFTTWYMDEALTEPASRYATTEGQTTLYARFVSDEEAVHVVLNAMGGRELETLVMGRGESLLTRPVGQIFTEKDGYTFGGWYVDDACTTPFSYSEPVEENMTLYAWFVSNEMQETTKDSGIVSMDDLDWQGTIALRTLQPMTAEEVLAQVEVIAGSGSTEPAVLVRETESGYVLYGDSYEQDGARGFEPGSTFTVRLGDQVRFADEPDDANTAVVSVYKEQVETVIFSDKMNYVLWDDVLSYTPVTEIDDQEAEQDETAQDTTTEVVDQDGEDAQELEQVAYLPGTILVREGVQLEVGDLVAFYDGEIGRNEKSMTAYTDGSFDGYVLYAQILEIETTEAGVCLTYGYADPEEYLAEFEVHTSEKVDLENELSREDLQALTAQLSRQVEENEELKAQLLVSVMTAPETQRQLDELYGEGVYSLAGMKATLKTEKPSVELSVSGSEVSARISISATATIKKDKRVLLTVETGLAFTQTLSVTMNVDGGSVWIDMSVSVRSTSAIELTMTATSGGDTEVFTEAKDTLAEIVKPEGIAEKEYETYDAAVSELMDTLSEIVDTSLQYNDVFDILLLKLRFSFYGIVTVTFEVHFVGQIGVLATFGVEIIATSGVKIGFKYNFLKFKGSSYTEQLESGVTNNIYLIGKIGARVGLRLKLSVTLCGIASASITGSVYAYAELSGLYFMTTNVITGASSALGGLKFEVGLDVVVSLGLKVNLLIKTIRKNWTVYSGRWPLWSTSISSKMTYVDEEKLTQQWAYTTRNTDSKTSFGFTTVPMKTWDLLSGDCNEYEQLFAQSGKFHLEIENMTVNGEAIGSDNPRYAVFTVGNPAKGQNPGYIYMDTVVAGKYGCEEVTLDVLVVYEDPSLTALVKKQTARFHLEKNCSISTTTQHVNVVLYDWCAKNWGIEAAEWDQQKIYETSFSSSHMIGGICAQNTTGVLDLETILAAAQDAYPELSEVQCGWAETLQEGNASIQYASPRVSNFCYMTTANGVVRFDVYPDSREYEVTYYLYVNRFEGLDGLINYHVSLDDDGENPYTLSLTTGTNGETWNFARNDQGVYDLTLPRTAFDGSNVPIMLTTPGGETAATGLMVTGREYEADVYLSLSVGSRSLHVTCSEGVVGWSLANEGLTAEKIPFGTQVELVVELEKGYDGLEVVCSEDTIDAKRITVEGNVVRLVMPAQAVSLTLQAYRRHSITYQYNYGDLDVYKTAYVTENDRIKAPKEPTVEGLTFRGWYTTEDCTGEPYAFNGKVKKDLVLYADWTCDVTVVFSPAQGQALYVDQDDQLHALFADDGKAYTSFTYSTLRVGEKLLNIQTPEYTGYQFMNWYLDKECKTRIVDLDTFTLTGDVTIYAGWAREVALTYVCNDPWNQDGAEKVLFQTIAYEGYPVPYVPEEPTCDYYRFTGWYRNPAATIPFDVSSELVSGDTTLYAGWEAITYAIHYDLTGGENAGANPASYTTEDSFVLEAPSRTGYTFTGWTGTDLAEQTEKVIVEAGNGGERDYQAHWMPVEYSITYTDTYGSAEENPKSYTIESEAIVLQEPAREKYEFQGWVGTGLTEAARNVVIPTGSIGNRSYRATWMTTDPTELILYSTKMLLEAHPYTTELVNFLTAQDLLLQEDGDNTQLNASLDAAVEAAVEAYLKTLVETDQNGCYECNDNRTEIGAYASSIQVDAALVNVDRLSDGTQQKYTYQLTIAYTDVAGVTYYETVEAYPVCLNKMVAQVEMPVMQPMTYGQSVAESQTAQEGYASYTNTDLGVEVPVPGSFVWHNEDMNKIPYGGSNGTSASQYRMMFMPQGNAAELYASVEQPVGLLTQIGVMVVCEAEDRYYIPNSTEANGTAKLHLVNADGTLGEEVTVEGLFSQGTFAFADAVPMQDKTVRYTGYGLNDEANTDEIYGDQVYCLLNPDGVTALATIKKIGQDEMILDNATTAQAYEYGEKLQHVTFESTMWFEDQIITGTWRWTDASEKLNTMPVSTHDAVFTPDDLVGYEVVTRAIDVQVTKKTLQIPTVTANLVYNGSVQSSGLQALADVYTVSDPGGKDAGDYEATLTLVDTEHYRWASTDEASVTIPYTIAKATAAVSGTAATVTMGYGQQLTMALTSGQTETAAMVLANKNISGLKVTFGGKTVAGKWEWDLSGTDYGDQPWSASDTPYEVAITFTPNDAGLAKNVETPAQKVDVKVRKSTPDVSECGITASKMYQLPDPYYMIGDSVTVTIADKNPKNPFNNGSVGGNWEWEDSTAYPTESGYYNYVFTPYPFAQENYDSVIVPVYVEVKQPAAVAYTVTAVEQVSNGGETWAADLFINGITSNVFSGATSGTMNAPVSAATASNSQSLSFTLSSDDYFVSAINIVAYGTKDDFTQFKHGKWVRSAPVQSETSYIYYRWNYVSRTGNTYTVTFADDYVPWEDVTVKVVIHKKTSTQALSLASEAVMFPVADAAVNEAPEVTNTVAPTETPVVTAEPEVTVTTEPTQEPTAEPTTEVVPTAEPEVTATTEPTQEPTAEPTTEVVPTAEPEVTATTEPTQEPTAEPTTEVVPTAEPEITATAEVTQEPTAEPTTEVVPTAEPEVTATTEVTQEPTAEPTTEVVPTAVPEVTATAEVTQEPTAEPTPESTATPEPEVALEPMKEAELTITPEPEEDKV